jgi:hypothetical protein
MFSGVLSSSFASPWRCGSRAARSRACWPSYLARTTDGQTFIVSVPASNPTASVNDAARSDELITLAHGAFELAARQPGDGDRHANQGALPTG